MAINYAIKYQPKVAERFALGSLTNAGAGNDYSFVGAKTIVVSSVNTVALTDFDRTAASNRFGAVENLGDTKQEMQMTQDKAFAFAIDAGDNSDTAIDKAAGKALRREIDEVVIPTIDEYRFEKWAAGAGSVVTGSALTKNTVLAAIIDVGGEMSNGLVPKANRTLYVPTTTYKQLVQADAVVALEKAGNSAVVHGSVGMIDGNHVIPVPDSWFPTNVAFIIKHKGCTVDPVKLQNYHIRKDAQGFDGPVVEGRIYFDSFVLDAKKAGVGVYKIS
jgi:hypothetical protein